MSGNAAGYKRGREGVDGEWTLYTGNETADEFEALRTNVLRLRVETAIRDYGFSRCPRLREVDLSNVTSIREFGAFRDCHSLETVKFCDWLEDIPDYAFQHCRSLIRVDIPSTVTKVGESAFEACDSLVAVNLCDGLEEIGKRAFSGCTSLKSVSIPSTVLKIGEIASYGGLSGEGPFSTCTTLVDVNLCEGLKEIGHYAFWRCSALKAITIPSTVTDIGCHAFSSCSSLDDAELREGLRTMGVCAFAGCPLGPVISIPSTVEKIGRAAYNSCTTLTSVELCTGRQTIDSYAFRDCSNLERISIPIPSFVIDFPIITGHIASCRLSRDGAISPDRYVMVVSQFVNHMSSYQLTEAENKVNAIIGEQGPLTGLTWDEDRRAQEERIARIRSLFAHYELVEATSILELAIWKANLDRGIAQDEEARQACRRRCGREINVVIAGALQYIESSN